MAYLCTALPGEESDNSCEDYSRSSSPSVCPSVEEYKGTQGQPELQALQQVVKDHKAATLTTGGALQSADCQQGILTLIVIARAFSNFFCGTFLNSEAFQSDSKA